MTREILIRDDYFSVYLHGRSETVTLVLSWNVSDTSCIAAIMASSLFSSPCDG